MQQRGAKVVVEIRERSASASFFCLPRQTHVKVPHRIVGWETSTKASRADLSQEFNPVFPVLDPFTAVRLRIGEGTANLSCIDRWVLFTSFSSRFGSCQLQKSQNVSLTAYFGRLELSSSPGRDLNFVFLDGA